MFEVNNSTQGTDSVRSVGNILEEGNGEDVSTMTKVYVAHIQEKLIYAANIWSRGRSMSQHDLTSILLEH